MKSKKLLYVGAFVVAGSVLAPSLFILWTFFSAFQALRANQTAGVGAVGGIFEIAIFGGLLMIAGVLTGTILILVGSYQNKHQSNPSN